MAAAAHGSGLAGAECPPCSQEGDDSRAMRQDAVRGSNVFTDVDGFVWSIRMLVKGCHIMQCQGAGQVFETASHVTAA